MEDCPKTLGLNPDVMFHGRFFERPFFGALKKLGVFPGSFMISASIWEPALRPVFEVYESLGGGNSNMFYFHPYLGK